MKQERIGSIEFGGIDFESAGSEKGQTEIPIQIGMAVLGSLGVNRDSLFRSFLMPSRKVTWAARKVHGISDEDLEDAPALTDLWPNVRSTLINRCAVAHGAGTEKRFLRAFPMHGFTTWVDTLTVARAAYPGLKSHALGELLDVCGLVNEVDTFCPDLSWHDALYDTVASLVFLKHVIVEARLQDEPLQTLISPRADRYYRLRQASGLD